MLEIQDLKRFYGAYPALKGISLKIGEGELHGFVGPNGAGKTTTIRILATLMKPSSGTARIDGVDLVAQPRKARDLIGYMPDFFGVYDHLKCWEYLDFYARCHGVKSQRRREMVRQLLELVQLEEKRETPVNDLSRGMKQRLCLAHALIHDPKLLLLDEPASGMDPRARAEMKGILRSLRDMGKTVLISSHILPELSEMCDSLTILDRGEVVFSGSVQALGEKMNGDAPVRILLSRASTEQILKDAARVLREFPEVRDVESPEDHVLTLRLGGGEDKMEEVLHALCLSGIPVWDFHRGEMNLEKVFMEVTGHD